MQVSRPDYTCPIGMWWHKSDRDLVALGRSSVINPRNVHDQSIAKTLGGTVTPPPFRDPSRGRLKPSPSPRVATSVMLGPAHLFRGHDHHSEELRTMTPIIAELVVSGLNRPVFAAAPPGVEGVLYVA